jgi:hypothetical protein|tara:strand:+ start:919 stop:1302 length:384 start_codon:yes stop_codon:yes gene_type:complete
MAHYAFLDSNNIVTEVIAGKDETDTSHDWEAYYSNIRGLTCKRTSYNTFGGVNNVDNDDFRKNYAGVGYSYDSTRDAFIPPQPYTSWVLDEDTCLWESPVPMPTEPLPLGEYYKWDEEIINWIIVSF